MEAEREKFEEQIEEARKEIKSETDEANALSEQAEILGEELAEIEKEKFSLSLEIEEERDALEAKQKEYDELARAQNERLVKLERLSGELRNERNNLETTENQIKKIDATLERLKNTIEKSREEISAVEILLEESERELGEAEEELGVLISERKEIESELNEIKNRSSALESQLQSLRHKRTEISDKIHELDMRAGKLEYERNGLLEHIREEYSVTLEYKEFDDNEEFDFDGTHETITRLKNQIKNLGPINLLAFSEYEEEKERLDFLLEQRNDLIESEKDLIKTIDEINEKAQTQFMEIFEQIRENFKINFRTLFDPGDEADLVMEENDDPLEAKIEIIAKPKGKRPTTIDLLSQGEKTLTATALLFAFYLVKPSPFCILDEVDAPLDDANIDRFTRLLKKFVERTQFIIVTHNKRTMEAADAMYGVTMVEDGVSKLAAIKFDELEAATQ
jgi:chromosome segregation protein